MLFEPPRLDPVDPEVFKGLVVSAARDRTVVCPQAATFDAAQVAELRGHLGTRACRAWSTPGSHFLGADWERFAVDDVDFSGATFGPETSFANATFGDYASFDDTTWHGEADFSRVSFGRSAQFARLRPLGHVLFQDGSFGDRLFVSIAKRGPRANDGGPHKLDFRSAVIGDSAQIWVEEHRMELGLVEATIGSWSTVTWVGSPGWISADLEVAHVGQGVQLHCVGGSVSMPRIRGESLRVTGTAQLTSLRNAHLGELELAGIDLTQCHWGGASIDKLRIGGGTRFARRRVLPFGPSPSRSVLREDHWSIKGPRLRRGAEEPEPPEVPIAEVEDRYRSIRGSLEQGGNGAAGNDFYYAEMQLRRLNRRFSNEHLVFPSVQGAVLLAYWWVSGYGLRAWRAVGALVVVLLVAAFLYSAGGMATIVSADAATSARTDAGTSQPATARPLTLGEGLVVAGQQGLSLHTRPGVELNASADAIGLALRLLVPLFLVLAALAVRNRISRHHPWR